MTAFMKSLCKIAIPVTLQSMLQASFSIIDQIMIGQLGETEISAVGLCGNYTMIFSVVIGAVGAVAGILIAQFIGAQDQHAAWSSFWVSMLVSIVISAAFSAGSLSFTGNILGLYTKDGSVIAVGCVYFQMIALAYVPMGMSTILSAWLRCKEHAMIPFAASLGAVIVNTGLNYVLIFGKMGYAPMGIRGAGIATLVSQLFQLALIIAGFVICLKKDHEAWTFSLHLENISKGEYVFMVAPILASEFLWSLGQNVESAVYGHLGTENLAAYMLTCPVQGMITGALSGLSAAAGVLIGKSLGKKQYEDAYADSIRIMLAGFVGAVVVSLLLVLLSGRYVDCYQVDDRVKELGRLLLIIFAIYAPVKVENMILGGGIIKSGGDTKTIMMIDIAGTWLIGIPLCLFAVYVLKWDIAGTYALLTMEEVARFAVTWVMFQRRKWMVSLAE